MEEAREVCKNQTVCVTLPTLFKDNSCDGMYMYLKMKKATVIDNTNIYYIMAYMNTWINCLSKIWSNGSII